MRNIVIEPVTRIEGHAKITLQMDDEGVVRGASFHVTQFRGFEKFAEGRPFSEMPSLMARVCGICPVSHLVASAKACDEILAVRIPPTAVKLRSLIHCAQIVQSHALSFFHLSSPDLLLGMDADPAKRNFFGVVEQDRRFAIDGVALRKFGQQAIEILGGKRIHPAWVVPGGVNAPLDEERRDRIRQGIPEAMAATLRALEWYRGIEKRFAEEIQALANFPSLFLGMVDARGRLEFYDGKLRVMDEAGNVIEDRLKPERYADYIGERVEEGTFLKSPYYKPFGYPHGIYRVGPLARLNVVDHPGTPLADEAWEKFRDMERGAVMGSFHYHHARLIEILFCLEQMKQLLDDPDILDKRVRALAGPNNLEGIGVAEAPRGTLIHHYKVDEHGLVQWVNLIIATGHNNLAMNRGILQAARHFVRGEKIAEGMLNRVEAVIRAFDPCLSCSTHAVGRMPLAVSLCAPDGRIVDEVRR
jgi:NAD-reducing hydrogenase large subunit